MKQALWSWVGQSQALRPTSGRPGRYQRPLSQRDRVVVLALGREIRRLRIARELSQRQLANLVGISQPGLNQIENTGRGTIHFRQVFDFAEALRVSPAALLKICMRAVKESEPGKAVLRANQHPKRTNARKR